MSIQVNKNDLNRKVFALNGFRGVDYASSPLEVKPYRATDMANLLLRDGMLRKRQGLKQVYKIAGLEPIEPDKNGNVYGGKFVKVYKPAQDDYLVVQICWIDEIVAEEGMAGNSTYLVIKKGNDGSFNQVNSIQRLAPLGTSINIGSDMYIFGAVSVVGGTGGILKYDGATHEMSEVHDYYIPTTTINIPFMKYGSESDGNGRRIMETDQFVAYPYTSNESANMLTNIVRNKLLARPNTFQTSETDLGVAFFKLDGKIPTVSDSTVVNPHTPVLKIKGEDGLSQYGVFKVKKGSELTVDLNLETGLGSDEYCWYNETAGLALCRSSKAGEIKGTEGNYSVLLKVNDKAFQTFLEKAKDTVYADDNGVKFKEFIIEYANENLGDTETDIVSCKCATLFGVDGANDRIFLSGGTKGNMVYISENDISLQPNPTYFPVDSFIVCGSADAEVSGFMRVTDGRLAVFKDIKTYEDVSVYYASGYYVDHTDTEIGTTYQEARFNVEAGDISRMGISARAIATLDGDNIFTAAEGVYGIQLSSNVASGERYAKERSRTINPKITWMNLSKSKGIVCKDKYFLSVGDGEVYVADARYKYTLQGDQQNTFNYEWFRLTGLYVQEWFVMDGKLHFIDKEGYICEFTDRYADEYMRTSANNELTVNDTTVTFVDVDLSLVKESSFAIDDKGRTWALELTDDKKSIFIPNDIEIEAGESLTLWFCKPVEAYWQSSVLSLDKAIMRKNMWSMAMTVGAEQGGRVDLGYKTRFTHKDNIAVQGVNAGVFEDINFIGGVSFDNGGYLGINTYRFRAFERGFTHLQVLFSSATTTDCAVSEIDIEYSTTIKNIGVG